MYLNVRLFIFASLIVFTLLIYTLVLMAEGYGCGEVTFRKTGKMYVVLERAMV